MLVFGHTGLTLGIATLTAGVITSIHHKRNRKVRVVDSSWNQSQATIQPHYNDDHKVSWFKFLADYVDIRLLLIGSMLPDIIDKPLWYLFFRQASLHGRTFGHSLFFLALTTIFGLYLHYRHSSNAGLLALSSGTFIHLVFDQMWRDPHTLLWPIYGFALEQAPVTTWEPNILYVLPELAGAGILLWFTQSLWRRRSVLVFLKHGKM